jgi:hypothetical protein
LSLCRAAAGALRRRIACASWRKRVSSKAFVEHALVRGRESPEREEVRDAPGVRVLGVPALRVQLESLEPAPALAPTRERYERHGTQLLAVHLPCKRVQRAAGWVRQEQARAVRRAGRRMPRLDAPPPRMRCATEPYFPESPKKTLRRSRTSPEKQSIAGSAKIYSQCRRPSKGPSLCENLCLSRAAHGAFSPASLSSTHCCVPSRLSQRMTGRRTLTQLPKRQYSRDSAAAVETPTEIAPPFIFAGFAEDEKLWKGSKTASTSELAVRAPLPRSTAPPCPPVLR